MAYILGIKEKSNLMKAELSGVIRGSNGYESINGSKVYEGFTLSIHLSYISNL